MRTVDHWIDGASVVVDDNGRFGFDDPITGDPLAEVAIGTATEIDRACSTAAAALQEWADLAPVQRGRMLQAMGRELRARQEEYLEVECSETGKLRSDMLRAINDSAEYFDYYGGVVRALFGETINLGAGTLAYTRREPYGVIAMITPWNSPLSQAARGIAPALAAGNTLVVKPSEFTPTTTIMLAELAKECGVPDGVFNVVNGTGNVTGDALVRHPAVRKIVFTGSVVAGRKIGQVAAENLIPVTLELGGKSPNVIFADADLDAAAPAAIAFSRNGGQVCSALTRLIVQSEVYEPFVERVTKLLGDVTPGDKLMPMTTPAQYEKVQEYFEVAQQDGARLLTGGGVATDESLSKGRYVQATAYADVTRDMRIFREEIFGPVITATPFQSEAEAIALANDSDYGLIASVWTRDGQRAHRVAARINAGQVMINGGKPGVETPFGGYKGSGIGREKGVEALHDYTQLKTIVASTGA
jgi:aldehyde dehydrogenase (NAD+)